MTSGHLSLGGRYNFDILRLKCNYTLSGNS